MTGVIIAGGSFRPQTAISTDGRLSGGDCRRPAGRRPEFVGCRACCLPLRPGAGQWDRAFVRGDFGSRPAGGDSYIGVASGRLDQSIILFAERGCLTRVDCSDLSIEQIPPAVDSNDYRVLVAFSGVRRTLVGSGFNARVDECREAARALLELAGEGHGPDPVLSDVAPEIFAEFGDAASAGAPPPRSAFLRRTTTGRKGH